MKFSTTCFGGTNGGGNVEPSSPPLPEAAAARVIKEGKVKTYDVLSSNMPIPSKPEAIPLYELPADEPNTANATVLTGDRREGRCVWIAYDAKGPGWPDDEPSVALVRLDRASEVIANGPNDEAFFNHRFCDLLKLNIVGIHEILHSPWVVEVLTLHHNERKFTGTHGLRHFVFALKETTVDCIAERATLIGFFPSHHAAMQAACAEIVT